MKTPRVRRLIEFAALLLAGFLPAFFVAAGDNGSSPSRQLQQEFIRVAEDVGPAVVSIITTVVSRDSQEEELLRYFLGLPPRRLLSQGFGTGVIIDSEGHILTNYHVLSQARQALVRLSDGREYEVVLTGYDAETDLAVIKIEASDLPSAPLGDSSKVVIGQWVVAVGNPFGLVASNPQPSITVGVVGALNRRISARRAERDQEYTGMIQTDAAINPGNSGGPLVNLDGEVIGINTAIYTTTGGFQGVGFAMPINRALANLDDLKKGNEIKRGWVGIWVQPVGEEDYRFHRPPDRRGALVARIESGSPAAEAGLRVGDIVRVFNRQPIIDHQDLADAIRFSRVGATVELSVWREGEEKTLGIKIGQFSAERGMPYILPGT